MAGGVSQAGSATSEGLPDREAPPREGGPAPAGVELGVTPWAVVDLETTGTEPWPLHRALEIGIVRLAPDGSVVEEYETLLAPGRPVEATEIHGITDGMVAAAPAFAEVAGDVARLLEGAVVVAHNVLFDVGFLRAEFQLAGRTLPPVAALCTAQLTRLLHPELECRLVDCCQTFGIEHAEPHSALSDARATARLLRVHLAEAAVRGLRTLADLEWLPGPPLAPEWAPWPPSGHILRRADARRRSVAAAPPATRGGNCAPPQVNGHVPPRPALAAAADPPRPPPDLVPGAGDPAPAASDPVAAAHGPARGAARPVDPATLPARAQALLTGLAGPEAALRPDQLAAVGALVVERRRALVVQRTGWGKSAVYFLATRLLRDAGAGPTLLVSPLLALMRDQIEAARRIGIRAATINSTNHGEWSEVERSLAAGEVDLLLVSPERLNNPLFRTEVLPALSAAAGLLVIDEAHCISDWGHDFRPDYRRIIRVLDAIGADVPVLATTATANRRVMADVADQLGVAPVTLRGSLDRESLVLSVLRLPGQAERLAWLAEQLPGLPGSGIVYCLTVADTERVTAWLSSRGIDARAYNGQADPDERTAVEGALRAGTVKVVVATSALGMGFDKPDLAFVVHFQSPDSPVTYYQQVGRAGRALPRAEAVLLCGAEDRSIWDWFATTAFPPRDLVAKVLDALDRAPGPLPATAIEETVNLGRSRIEALLKVLDVEGAVRRERGGWARTGAPWTYDEERHARVAAAREAEQTAMLAYATTDACLMAYLRRQLDDPGPADCGRCANCTGHRPPAAADPALAAEAGAFLLGHDTVVEPRRLWPRGLDGLVGTIPPELRVEPGRALATAGAADAGWGRVVARLLATDGPAPEEVVQGVVRVLARWEWATRPTWVTFVPSRSHPRLVESLATCIAELGRLPLHPVLERARDAAPQATMSNSTHQCRNVHGALAVAGGGPVPRGAVLLVDDVASSRWTLTTAGAALRQAGAGPVLPLVLLLR